MFTGKTKDLLLVFVLILDVVAVKESQAVTYSAYQSATDTITLVGIFYSGNYLLVESVI